MIKFAGSSSHKVVLSKLSLSLNNFFIINVFMGENKGLQRNPLLYSYYYIFLSLRPKISDSSILSANLFKKVFTDHFFNFIIFDN